MACGVASAQARFEASLRQLYPIAIGLMSPKLLRKAKSVPPNKVQRSSGGQTPASRRLKNAVVGLSCPDCFLVTNQLRDMLRAEAFRSVRRAHGKKENPGAYLLLSGL